MASEVSLQELDFPGGRRVIITDVTPGRSRPAQKGLSFTEQLILQSPLGLFTTGSGRLVFGQAPRNEARERLVGETLLAKLQRSQAEGERIRAQTELIRKETVAVTPELGSAKVTAILRALPLDLFRRRVQIRAEEAEIAREDALLPFIINFRQSQAEENFALAEKRRTEAAIAFELVSSAREKAEAVAEFTRAKARQERLNRDLVEKAIGGLDGFSKMIFLRDRLFPPVVVERGQERTLSGRLLRTRRTIASF